MYAKKEKNISCLCFDVTTLSFKGIENKSDVHRGKDCIKKFRKFLT